MNASNNQSRRSFGKWLLHEIKLVWIMTAYFAIGFGLILLMQNLLLADRGGEQIGYVGAVILAALIGKVVIVIENMPFTKKFRHRRRIVYVFYRTMVFTLIALLVGAIEKIIKKLIHGDAFADALRHVWDDASLSKFLAITIAITILFSVLFLVREFDDILGEDDLLKALFRRPDAE